MHRILLIFVVCLMPLSTVAQSVAVLSVKYEMVWTGAENHQAAKELEQTIVKEVRDAGYEVKDAFEVGKGLVRLGVEECADVACAKELADQLGVDEVVMVSVKNNDDVEFVVEIKFAFADPVSQTKAGSYKSIMEWIGARIVLSLPRIGKLDALDTDDRASQPEDNTSESPADVQPESPDDGVKSGLTEKKIKMTFWTFVALTASTAITGGLTTAFATQSRDKLEDPDEWSDAAAWSEEKERFTNLKISSVVLWSVAGVFALASTTFGILAYAKIGDDTVVAPAATNDGAMLLVQGRF